MCFVTPGASGTVPRHPAGLRGEDLLPYVAVSTGILPRDLLRWRGCFVVAVLWEGICNQFIKGRKLVILGVWVAPWVLESLQKVGGLRPPPF